MVNQPWGYGPPGCNGLKCRPQAKDQGCLACFPKSGHRVTFQEPTGGSQISRDERRYAFPACVNCHSDVYDEDPCVVFNNGVCHSRCFRCFSCKVPLEGMKSISSSRAVYLCAECSARKEQNFRRSHNNLSVSNQHSGWIPPNQLRCGVSSLRGQNRLRRFNSEPDVSVSDSVEDGSVTCEVNGTDDSKGFNDREGGKSLASAVQAGDTRQRTCSVGKIASDVKEAAVDSNEISDRAQRDEWLPSLCASVATSVIERSGAMPETKPSGGESKTVGDVLERSINDSSKTEGSLIIDETRESQNPELPKESSPKKNSTMNFGKTFQPNIDMEERESDTNIDIMDSARDARRGETRSPTPQVPTSLFFARREGPESPPRSPPRSPVNDISFKREVSPMETSDPMFGGQSISSIDSSSTSKSHPRLGHRRVSIGLMKRKETVKEMREIYEPLGEPKRKQCSRCDKIAFIETLVEVSSKFYHHKCLRCAQCNAQVEVKNYSAKDGQIFCKTCYTDQMRPQLQKQSNADKSGSLLE